MKALSILVVLALVFSCLTPVAAVEIAMSDAEYEAQVAAILATYTNNPEAAKKALQKLGATLISAPSIVAYNTNSNVRGTSPSDYELSVASTKRSNSNRIYLTCLLIANTAEWFPGPLDYMSLEWDTAYGSYYSSSTSGKGCTVQGRDTGIVLFNIEDDKLSSGDYVYGTVQVEPISSGWMEYGSKFVHTYTSFNITGSASYSFTPSASISGVGGSLGLSYTKTFSVNVSTSTNQWQMWTDNAVNIS